MKLIFPLAFIILSIFIVFTFVKPLYKEVNLIKADVELYKVALNNSTDLQKTKDALVAAYKNINPEDMKRLINFLPDSANSVRFILEVEQLASIHQLSIKKIDFKPIESEAPVTDPNMINNTDPNNVVVTKPYGIFTADFTIEGKYENFVSLLKDIESNLRLIDIISVTIEPPILVEGKLPAGVDPNIYTYIISMETYWLK